MIRILQRSRRLLARVAIDQGKDPLRIAVIGEIYTVIEPFTNLYIEERLMDLGVSTERYMTPTWWLTDMVLKPPKLNSPGLRLASRPYLKHYVGGHCRECIGEAMQAQRKGLDGAIQIFPMGCMPEIVAKAILPSISRDRDFPILTLIVDEMTGEAGYVTRIEAFLDMLERKRNTRRKAN
jgi:predicted nucleotide-binding protein (sugar kinase/HSP70/actin superfamily)